MFEVLKALLALIGIPLLLTLYAARWDKITGGFLEKALKKNWVFVCLLAIATVAVCYLEYKDYTRKDPSSLDVELELLDETAYRSELENFEKNGGSSTLGSEKTELIRQFETVNYAWSKHDYDRVVSLLTCLRDGRDSQGAFPIVPSYTVENNLACAFFKLQRNKKFDAYRCFHEAELLAKSNPPIQDKIKHNIDLLDRMVNRLD